MDPIHFTPKKKLLRNIKRTYERTLHNRGSDWTSGMSDLLALIEEIINYLEEAEHVHNNDDVKSD